MTLSPRVLVVEDEPNIRELVCLHLNLEGYACDGAGDGHEALRKTEAGRYDLLVLDVMIPGVDGLAVCRAVRGSRTNHDVPILMLTARREESDRVLGLESGADDYLVKPFGVRELVARARALLRRPRQTQSSTPGIPGIPGIIDAFEPPITVRGIDIDPARRRVHAHGQDVNLTDQEFRLLYLLASHAGIVFTREALLQKIWRGDTYVTVRSVDTLVKRVRRRIEDEPANPKYLRTIWGVGYKFADL